MVKFLALAAAALATVFGGAQAADKTPCVPLNFNGDGAANLAIFNTVIDIAKPILKSSLAPLDPYAITNKRLDAIPFSVLGVDFTLTPIIQTLNVGGISNVLPRHLNATAAQALDIGADFPGNVSLDATVVFEIAQLNHQWWQICWTNILKPAQCPPASIIVDVGVALENLSLFTNANVAMVKCSPTAPAGTCTDVTVTDILSAAITQQFTGLLTRILNRVESVSLTTIRLGFDKIDKLVFNFPQSGSLLQELGKALLKFSTTELNKKGDLYNAVIDVSDKLATTLLNQLIQEKLAPQFKNTCYDA